MPLYEYQCRQCKKVHEDRQTISHRKVWFPCECGGVADQIFTTVPAVNGITPDDRQESKYWRDPPSKFYMNDKRKRK